MVERCAHCGREGTLEHVEDVVLAQRETEVVFHSAGGEHAQPTLDKDILNIRRCSVCFQPTLATYRWIEDWSDPADFDGWRVIYPATRDPDVLPPRIAERYGAMLELIHAPDVFAVRAGKLLEAICTDRGIPRKKGGRDVPLATRLDRLVSGGAVPDALAQQAKLVKDYRNLGGHDNDVEVRAKDVPLLREFVESILEYLYWAPKKRLENGGKALQARLDSVQVQE